MKCPVCNSKNEVAIDLHSDGYAGNLLECTACGTVWTSDFGIVRLLKRAA